MKPFVFKLQSALNLKFREEDRLKERLHEANLVYRKNVSILAGLQCRLEEICNIIRGKQTDNLNIQEIRTCSEFIAVLNQRIVEQERVTEDSRIKMENVRSELLQIVRERKVMEKLKARHYKDYLNECLRQEQKEIDEMAMAGYMHKGSAV